MPGRGEAGGDYGREEEHVKLLYGKTGRDKEQGGEG